MANEIGQSEETATLSSHAHNFPIVGIGASAGGLDAFKQFLQAITVDSNMAYVVVQHLSPEHDSQLTEILSRVTKIPIQEITDEVMIFPNHIYVMPSGKLLTSVDGVLKLTPRKDVKTNLVIDIFFTSIAVVWESMAVGVVLSGTGTDGTLGLKMIKDHGGTTIVQDESADHDGMPQSAVDANVVDFVLPAEKIPAQLMKINNATAFTNKSGEEELLHQNDEVIFKQILQLLHKRSGVDFTYYKQSTIHRRIGRRMALHKRGDLADYLKFLQSNKEAQDALFQDMLIHVTSFFRDVKTFETLTEKVLPTMLKSKPPEDAIRFWIAGCATGEEAYSLAICLHEFLGKNLAGRTINIFASDISQKAIKTARAGIYSEEKVQTVSEDRLSNYFAQVDGGYQVNKAIRDLCVFANQNFLKDPPFAKLDLISCRNVLIYMEPLLQKRALTTFHYALKENGTLLLGKSETVSAAAELFTTVDKQHRIYSRKPGAGRFMQVATGLREETLTTQNTEAKKETLQADFRSSADAILISKSPAAVIVNEALEIVHIHGDVEPFLKLLPGKASLNLLKMAREVLAIELRTAIHKVKASENSVIKDDISLKANGKKILVTVEVFPLNDTAHPHYLILFTKNNLPAANENGKTSSSGKQLKNHEALIRNETLERELARTREDMVSVTDEMEASNEELQTANEELQSSNEELQSLNEELETSGEELQSTNEELTSLNLELLDREDQLNAALDYAEAIVSTIKEPLLVLDKNLRVKSANDSFYKKFNVAKTETIGRHFYELQNYRWNNNELRNLLENILPQQSKMEDFEMIMDERTMLLNAREIVSKNNLEPLMLLAIEDVTDTRMAKKLKKSEARLAGERQVLYNSFMKAPGGIAILKGNTHIYEFANDTYEVLVGKSIIIGKTVHEHFPEIEQQGFIQMLNNVFITGEPFINNEIPIALNKKGDGALEKLFLNLVVQPLKDENGNTERILAHVLDVTESVDARKQIEASENQFRTFADSIQSLAWIANADGWIYWYNQQWYDYTGTTFEEMQGWGWEKVQHPEHVDRIVAFAKEAWTKDEAFELTFPLRRHDGEYRWFLTRAYPLKDANRNIERWIGINTDITEQKTFTEQLEKQVAERTDELLEKNLELELINSELASFNYVASHDLKEPLRKIQAFTNRIIETEIISGNTLNYFEKITSAATRMQNLIDSLLSFSSLITTELVFEPCDLNTLVEESKNDLHVIMIEKQVTIEYENLPVIMGVCIQISQLITNLLGNAIKYSRAEIKPLIKITSSVINGKEIEHPSASKKTNYHSIEFADNGIGFEQEYADKIFELFQRLHGKNEYSGTGIGLGIVKKIITSHNGFITAKGTPNVGATFTIYLPTE